VKGFAYTLFWGTVFSLFTAVVVTRFFVDTVVDNDLVTSKAAWGAAAAHRAAGTRAGGSVDVLPPPELERRRLVPHRLGDLVRHHRARDRDDDLQLRANGRAAAAGALVHRRYRRQREVHAPHHQGQLVAALATIGSPTRRSTPSRRTPASRPANAGRSRRSTISATTPWRSSKRSVRPRRTIAPTRRSRRSARRSRTSTSLNALKALVIAISIQFIYIAFRFGWNLIFGWVCVVALVRDSLMMIGIYALAGKRVDDAFLAAVLTVIGYSVMDTIVILDRIRENVKLMDGKPFDEIVNTSILQTMTRSVNTLATVVITLVALLAFGGASLQNFAFALLVGVCSGGYHSIFFSAPLVAVLQKRVRNRKVFRGSSFETPKTVAQARAQSAAAALRDREEVAALRRARRERERDGASRRTAAPPRYKRTRQEQIDFEKLENRNFGVPDRPRRSRPPTSRTTKSKRRSSIRSTRRRWDCTMRPRSSGTKRSTSTSATKSPRRLPNRNRSPEPRAGEAPPPADPIGSGLPPAGARFRRSGSAGRAGRGSVSRQPVREG
jgi:preprotein translocase SecF subunit